MQTHSFETSRCEYAVTLQCYGYNHDRRMVRYILGSSDNPYLFEGEKYSPSPMFSDPEGYESAIGLLGFLTLKEGDTDDEFFKDYTQEQLAFCRSMDCEELSLIVYDHENGEEEEES